jgi:2-alkyl-3-oxoalkanoate reductase
VVYKEVTSPDLDDDSPPASGHWMPYARAKSSAEVMLRGQLAAAPCQVVVLRPGIVWGVRSPHTMSTVEALLEKRAYMVGDGRGVFNSIFIDNMVACIRACCDHPEDIRGFYNVGDDEYVTWRDFHSSLAGPLGYDMARMPMVSGERMPWSGRAAFDYAQSLPIFNGLYHWLKARAPDTVKTQIKRRLSGSYEYGVRAPGYVTRPPVDREIWHLQRVRHKLPTAKFASRFGFTPPVSFADGVRRTLLWIRSLGCEASPIAGLTEHR